MATAAFNAQGTTVTIEGTAIAEVVEFSGPSIETPRTQATHLGSTAHEYIPGIQDNGEFTMTVNYLPTDPGQLALRAAQAAKTAQDFVITLPGNRETWAFAGIVTNSEPDPGEVFRMGWTVAVTGAITYTAGT